MSNSFLVESESSKPSTNNNAVQPRNRFRFDLVEAFCVSAGVQVLGLCGVSLAVAVGVCIGNGVPMARSASDSFRMGMQAGLSQCPCAKKGTPTAVTQTALKPVPVPQEKAATVKAALLREIEPVTIPVRSPRDVFDQAAKP